MSLFNELKRRNVFRVALAYAAVAWLLIQVSDVIIPALGLPPGIVPWVIILFAIGLPIVLVISWFYELTPGGLVRESEMVHDEWHRRFTGRQLDFAIIAVLTMALGYFIWESRFGDAVTPAVPAAIPHKSIAVLPFADSSAEAENAEFFAAGVHDELLTLLSRLGDLKVTSRTSVERLDRNLRIPEIATLLGVATVLEGQVQRAGDRLRINVQLIDTANEQNLWANTYDRELTAASVFEVQSDIARTIAHELDAQLSLVDEALLRDVPTVSTAALDLFLQGQQLVRRYSFEPMRRAVDLFRQATTLDPDYAEAWTAIGDASNLMLLMGMTDVQEYLAVAGPAVARALELDEDLPQAHAQLARLRWHSGEPEGAEASFRKALRLNPGDSDSLAAYAEFLRNVGRPAEAVPLLERALESDPLSVNVLFELGKSEMYLGHPERNVAYGEQILALDPTNLLGYAAMVQANLWRGRYDLLWPWYIKLLDTDPEDYENWSHLALYANQLGATDWADRYLQRALEIGASEPAVIKCGVQIAVMRGEHDTALALARGALEADLTDRWFSRRVFLRVVRDSVLETGVFEEALDWYRRLHPELFESPPRITVENVNAAADLALLRQRAGLDTAAATLIDAGLEWYRRTQPPGVHGYLLGVVDAELLALSGDRQAALDALQAAADSGWGFVWQWDTMGENLASLRSEPQFQSIVAKLEDQMAQQLDVVRMLPDMGKNDLRFVGDAGLSTE